MLHDPVAAVDDNPGTHWKPGRRTDIDWHAYYGMNINYRNREVTSLYHDAAWLEVDLGRDVPVGRIRIMEHTFFNSTIAGFEVQALQGTEWKPIAGGTRMGDWAQRIDPVTARKFRLVIRGAEGMPGIREFQLFSN
jgi:alpha-L-fucosidase